MTNLLLFYGAGSIGALVETLISWGLAEGGLMRLAHSSYHLPVGTPALYMRMVWGGIWSMGLLFPGMNRLTWLQTSLFLCVAPSVAQLLYFLPQSGAGWFGSELGWGTPILVVVLNLIWALFTAFFALRARR